MGLSFYPKFGYFAKVRAGSTFGLNLCLHENKKGNFNFLPCRFIFLARGFKFPS